MRSWLTIAMMILFATTAHADDSVAGSQTVPAPPRTAVPATPVAPSGTPPLEPERLGREVMVGMGAGLGSAAVGAALGFYISSGGYCDVACAWKVTAGGAAIGYPFGVAVGVVAVGRSDYENGSVGAAIGGAAVGMAGAIGIAMWTDNPGARVAAIVGLPVASSTILFNLTRRYDMNVVPLPTRNGVALAGAF